MDVKLKGKKENTVKHKPACETEEIDQTTKRKYTETEKTNQTTKRKYTETKHIKQTTKQKYTEYEDDNTNEGSDNKLGIISNRQRSKKNLNNSQKKDNSAKRRRKKSAEEPQYNSGGGLVEGSKELFIVAGPSRDRTHQCSTIQTHPKIKNPPPAPPPPQSGTRYFDLDANCINNQFLA
ncbi:uncharacterized protein LOC134258156 [Saccostrea cucullata]|uniref:uncharacterized protein LOC134258156 n=1 Tax=Saccostrea cuccullata TaxID=36930 RepID=UPI002ED5B988